MAITRESACAEIERLRAKIRQARAAYDQHVEQCAHCSTSETLCLTGTYRNAIWQAERGDLTVFARKAARFVRM